ncbi:helix-turn-helix domain-containing protein [Rhodococcus sp. X156]|uniref:helix-turn-helix domain-containing protein n=1 Tax=Rhodococcus sp. X156 TaxID=2499145 RepID=UPI000FDB1032|nr:helix-turn-helix domain-containing protein [Rhodococcus sp. X156]
MSSPAAGRPRDPRIDTAALAATRELLLEVGWEEMSMRSIAARAGVGRSALTRRWPSKAHLVLDALLGEAPDLTPFAGTDRRGWVQWVVDGASELFSRPEVRAAVPGLLAALRDREDLRTELWQGFSVPATAMFAGADDEGQALRSARAALVLAGGAALLLSLVATEDDTPQVHEEIVRLLAPIAD